MDEYGRYWKTYNFEVVFKVSKTQFGLKYAMAARQQLGF